LLPAGASRPLSDSEVIFTLQYLLVTSGLCPRQLDLRANAAATIFAVRAFCWTTPLWRQKEQISMQRKILALAAAGALAAMTIGAMAAPMGGGRGGGGGHAMGMGGGRAMGMGGGHAMGMGGGHAMSMGGGHAMGMGGGHAMSMGGARTGTWGGHAVAMGTWGGHAVAMGGPRMGTWGGARTWGGHAVAMGGPRMGTWGHPATGAWAHRTWAGGNWGHRHHRRFFIGGLGLGLLAYNGYPYDCYNWPYRYRPPYDSCYGYGYAW
jgi:hypothetical protein